MLLRRSKLLNDKEFLIKILRSQYLMSKFYNDIGKLTYSYDFSNFNNKNCSINNQLIGKTSDNTHNGAQLYKKFPKIIKSIIYCADSYSTVNSESYSADFNKSYPFILGNTINLETNHYNVPQNNAQGEKGFSIQRSGSSIVLNCPANQSREVIETATSKVGHGKIFFIYNQGELGVYGTGGYNYYTISNWDICDTIILGLASFATAYLQFSSFKIDFLK